MILTELDDSDKTDRKINTASCAPFLKFFNKPDNNNLKSNGEKKRVTIGEVYVRLLEKCKNKDNKKERRKSEGNCIEDEVNAFRRTYRISSNNFRNIYNCDIRNNNGINNEKVHDAVGEMYLRTLKSFKSSSSLCEKKQINNFVQKRKNKPEVIYPKNREEYLKKLNNVDNLIDFKSLRKKDENKRDVVGEMYLETLKKFKSKSHADLSKKNTSFIVDQKRNKSELINRSHTKDNFFNISDVNSKINKEDKWDTVGLMYLNTLKSFKSKSFIKPIEVNEKLKDSNVIKKAFDHNKQTNNIENNSKPYSAEELYLRTLKSLRKTKNMTKNTDEMNENNFYENSQKNISDITFHLGNHPLSFYFPSAERLSESEDKLMKTGSEALKFFNLSSLIVEAIDKMHITSKDVVCYE